MADLKAVGSSTRLYITSGPSKNCVCLLTIVEINSQNNNDVTGMMHV